MAGLILERLYAASDWLNDHNQSVDYGRAGACVVTGNEDGIKHCAMSVLYVLSHLRYVIPPHDAGWIGERPARGPPTARTAPATTTTSPTATPRS